MCTFFDGQWRSPETRISRRIQKNKYLAEKKQNKAIHKKFGRGILNTGGISQGLFLKNGVDILKECGAISLNQPLPISDKYLNSQKMRVAACETLSPPKMWMPALSTKQRFPELLKPVRRKEGYFFYLRLCPREFASHRRRQYGHGLLS